MGPLILVAGGGIALLGGVLVLRSFGAAYRVGRLLGTAPRVTVEEALGLARQGRSRYVAVRGRVDADEAFPDEHRRPLVLRRARLQVRRFGRWRTVQEERRSVPFEIHEGISAIGVDGDALDEGLVVIPRESRGSAAEVADRVPAAIPPSTPVRLRVDQVSAVEHATVAGVPVIRDDAVLLSAGEGRPLLLATLETDEAMRILAGGRRLRPVAAAFLLVAGLGLLATGFAWALVVRLSAT